jgi:hypothetical protein
MEFKMESICDFKIKRDLIPTLYLTPGCPHLDLYHYKKGKENDDFGVSAFRFSEKERSAGTLR